MKENNWKQFLTEGKKLAEAAIMKRNYTHPNNRTIFFNQKELDLIKSFQRAFVELSSRYMAEWKWKADGNEYVLYMTKEDYKDKQTCYVSECQFLSSKREWRVDSDRKAISQPFDGEEDLRLLKAFLTELKIGQ